MFKLPRFLAAQVFLLLPLCLGSLAAAAASGVPVCTLSASPASIQRGAASTLTASCVPAANSYQWGNSGFSSTSSRGSVSPRVTTTYTVAGSNAAGTGSVASATVTVVSAGARSVAPLLGLLLLDDADSSASAAHLRPEAGFRVSAASNPFATVDSSGTAYLGYQDRSDHDTTKFQSSSDGLNFSGPTLLTYNNRSVDSRKTLMPDGVTWRLYQFNLLTKQLTSYSSSDGNVFTADSGVRYTPAAADNNSFGVYDSYVASDNSLILIYVGDLYGRNNLRMARSTDNGLSFTYLKGNVLGDDDAGGGANSYVDNKTILLADGRRRMLTMRANQIYSFISSDGLTYTKESGASLKPSDFASVGVTIYSLNDPVMVRTKDGKYRAYIAASTSSTGSEAPGNTNWAIVSALWND